MADTIDLDAYLARIGYGGSRAPTLETLRGLHERHARTLPFESLDPLLGRPVSLALECLEEKMIGRSRGGYCFEQNTLFRAALEAMGFQVQSLLARMRWNRPDGLETARTHMVLRMNLPEGPFIADVGFAGHGLVEPLKLRTSQTQRQARGHYRFLHRATALELQVEIRGEWRPIHRLDLEAQAPIDFEAANWFTATHPQSQFRHTLIMGIVGPEVRHTLTNRVLKTRHMDGSSTERLLDSVADLAEIMENLFGVASPVPVDEVFARLP
jgi:N-hydroxyarylamine O-acetyltransferase